MSRGAAIKGFISLGLLIGVALLSGCVGNISGKYYFGPGVVHVPPIEERIHSVPSGTVEIRSGNIFEEGQVDEYKFTPTVSGTHRFEVDNMIGGSRVEMYVYNQLGHLVSKTGNLAERKGNQDGFNLSLEAGEEYSIYIKHVNALTPYTFLIGHKKPFVDVSDFTLVSDSMQYRGQINNYVFVPDQPGDHRFEVTGMLSGHQVDMYVYNHMWHLLTKTGNWAERKGNGDGFTLALVPGEEYYITLAQVHGLGDYKLVVGHKKPVVDMYGKRVVVDSVQYTGQVNTYTFTPRVSGNHSFVVGGLPSGHYLRMYILNPAGQLISKTGNWAERKKNGEGFTLHLLADEEYTIHVAQGSHLGEYNLEIKEPERIVPLLP